MYVIIKKFIEMSKNLTAFFKKVRKVFDTFCVKK